MLTLPLAIAQSAEPVNGTLRLVETAKAVNPGGVYADVPTPAVP